MLVFEHKALFAVRGTIPPEDAIVPLGVADIVREGGDVTIVATQLMRHRAVEAASQLATEGIQATVIDPRTLVPFDDAAVVASLRVTSRLAVVQEAPTDGSWGSSLIARMLTGHFELFDAAPVLISAAATPVPYASNLEAAWLPSVDRIVAEVRKQVSY